MKTKALVTTIALLAMAARAEMTYAPFLFAANDADGVPIANGTYVMVADLDGDGWGGNAYVGQAVGGDNASSWLWDADDLLLDRGPIVDGAAYPFEKIATADIPETYDAGVDSYYVLWFDTPYDAGAAGPGEGVDYGAENAGALGTDPGTYSPILTGGVASYATIAGGGAVNNPPVLAAIGAQQVDEHQALAFTVTATDPNDTPPDALTLSATGLPAGASFDPGTGEFAWTPAEDQQGVYQVEFTVTDDGTPNLQDSETVTITVNEVNAPPVLAAIGDRQIDELQTLVFTVTAADPNDIPANAVTLSVDGLPAGAEFNPDTGAFSWRPNGTQAGAYGVTFTATDDGVPNLEDSETITITVNPVDNHPPVAQSPGTLQTQQETPLTVSLTATDEDEDELTLSIVQTPASGAVLGVVDQQAQEVVYTPPAGFTGQDHFSFKASDAESDSATVDVYIYVSGNDGWLVKLEADTADFPALYFGAEANASDGYDDIYDLLLPGEIVPTRAVRNFAGLYRPLDTGAFPAYFLRDIRQLEGDYFWVLELEAFDEALTITWDTEKLPADLTLRITACDADGVALTPGDEGVPMGEMNTLVANPEDGVKHYRIDGRDEEEFPLVLNEGWNLISIPLAPTNPAVEVIFAEIQVQRGTPERTMRDGGRGRITSGQVWDWDETGQNYVAVTELQAHEGYWVFVPEGNGDLVIDIRGRKTPAPTTLRRNWNLRGVDEDIVVASDDVSSSIWMWLDGGYHQTATLYANGLAYWLFSLVDDGVLVDGVR